MILYIFIHFFVKFNSFFPVIIKWYVKRGDNHEYREVSLVGLPMDLGQRRRGVDMGPSAIRYAGIVERLESLKIDVEDLGDIVINRLTTVYSF